MNATAAIERVLAPAGNPWTWQDLVSTTWNMERPVLPAPHQIALDFWSGLVDWPLDSPRNLLFHVAVTGETTLVGFVLGTLLGLVLAVLIVHSRTLDRALLPWIVASQTVPVLAIAPIVLVILGSLGLEGLAPKAVIAMYLSFFPVTVAMVQGLRSPQVIETEMMHTYAASAGRRFGCCACRQPCRFCSRPCAWALPPAWWVPWWPSCPPAPRRAGRTPA
jgi:NitT/TauT family transport system permease protein